MAVIGTHTMSALSNYLRARMAERNWVPATLAVQSEIPKQTLSNILNDKNIGPPEIQTLYRLAKGLGVSFGEVLEVAGLDGDASLSTDADVLRLARLVRAIPWVEAALPRLVEMSREDFDEMMTYMEFRLRNRTNPETDQTSS